MHERTIRLSGARPAIAAAALFALLGAEGALAQEKKVPGWAQGRPAELENSPLAPHAGKMTVTSPAEIPLDKILLPPGFKVEIWAHGMPGARMMTRGNKGTIFVGTRGIVNLIYGGRNVKQLSI